MPKKKTEEIAAAARTLGALRETFAGGRPKVLRRCPGCGGRFGAREMRAHRCDRTAPTSAG